MVPEVKITMDETWVFFQLYKFDEKLHFKFCRPTLGASEPITQHRRLFIE